MSLRTVTILAAAAITVTSISVRAQVTAPTAGGAAVSAKDTTVIADSTFHAGGFQRFLMGDTWRDEWSTPIAVPFLDLGSIGGGLHGEEIGGGLQTATLHLRGKNGREYLFRPVDKGIPLPDIYRHTLVWKMVADERSSLYPAAPVLGDPILTAAGIPHPSPVLVVMPNDPALGEFRRQFAGILGTFEEAVDKPDSAAGFMGAAKIIDSDELLEKIDRDPSDSIDARAYLAARLVDMLLNDNDRHPGQWEWARFRSADSGPWIPVPKDRDKVIHSEEGLLPKIAGMAATKITAFDSTYPDVSSLITQALEMDRRLLGQLERPVWDSVAAALVSKITDPVIDASVNRLPHEYSFSFGELSGKLKARRNELPGLARRFYDVIAEYADIHATDAAERATVVRSGEGTVDVSIQSGNAPPYFRRRFNANETKEIRLYLHGGDDAALIRGNVQRTIPVRIIGGDGTNSFVDSSRVAGQRNPTHLYDVGTVSGVRYDADSLDKREFSEEVSPFNRRPWSVAYGKLAPAQKDRGSSLRPIGSIGSGHGLGLVPSIGIARYSYGFRKVPYASMMSADVSYSTAINGFDVDLDYDKRLESSSFHLPVSASMRQLGVVEFRGFGNDIADLRGPFYEVRERQWSFRPALGFSPNAKSDISLGPVVRHTATDSTPNRFISQLEPYGFGKFSQAGVGLEIHYDTRGSADLFQVGGRNALVYLAQEDSSPVLWGKLDLNGTVYPAMLDVQTPYQKLSGVVSAYLSPHMLKRPVLALRGGGEKLYGSFPYFDAAFIGGSHSFRTESRQRWAGDAAVFGTSELRVPLANFPLILPLNVGAIGFIDLARVYSKGESPGGWHQGSGAGLWVSFVRPELGISFMHTNNPDRPWLTTLGFAF